MQDLKPFSPDYNKKCFLPKRKSYLTYSLFTITYYFQKNSPTKISEKWKVKSEEVKKYPRNKSEEFFWVEAPKKMQDLKPFSPDYNKKCFLPKRKSYLTYSLFTITYYFQKNSPTKISEKWKVKSEEVKKYPRNKSEEFFWHVAPKKISA